MTAAGNISAQFGAHAKRPGVASLSAATDRVRSELRKFILELEPSVFLTLNYGYEVQPVRGDGRADQLFNRVEDAALGRNWHKLPGHRRLIVAGCWEHVERAWNPHLHLAVGGPERVLWTLLNDGRQIWKSLEPRGQFHAEPMRDQAAVVSYVTKRLAGPINSDLTYYRGSRQR